MAGVFFFYRGPELFGRSLRIAHTTATQPPEPIPSGVGHTWHPGSPGRGAPMSGGPNLGFSLLIALCLCLWCFDLLSLDGVRITPLALVERKALLANLVSITLKPLTGISIGLGSMGPCFRGS